MNSRIYYTYILTNRPGGVLYVGITNDIFRRIGEHKSGMGGQFSAKYGTNRLVYFEIHLSPGDAIRREKQIKKFARIKKIALIEKQNPDWLDLSQS